MKNKNEDLSKKFLLEFFKDSRIEDKKGVLTIDEVPKDFETFVGKKAPYKFVFDINLHNKVKDSELIMQGSYFLLAIRDYLRDKGQTSLLKIDIKPNLIEIGKKLKKYKIIDVKPGKMGLIYEFSFLSTYQYLNDKKQSMNKILINDKDIMDIDISKLRVRSGNKDDVSSIEPIKPLQIAKKILNEKIDKDIKSIKLILKEKLKKELFRVKDHYFKQIKEKDEEVESCANKIKMLQSKLRHTAYWRDIDTIKRMIRESQERLEMLKKKSYRERLRAEEVFHIKDEVEKHALLIKNSLINVTVFYYPLLDVHVSSKGKKRVIVYDPILEQ